ncbi:COMM domain-containing 8 [Brachionus plicatilis]|uniref:COMM domain-containing 8 n=1 Tax=Brachionus plicatilis TaxID=10195 RepID=A0A3M7QXL0_BRAPC|nr:COMM domain-containing 8 [Brachionus plicatilis]
MIQYDSTRLNKLIENFDSNCLVKYIHELIDSWINIGKLTYVNYSHLIELEDWWKLEKEFDYISKMFIYLPNEQEFKEKLQLTKNIDVLINAFKNRKNDLEELIMTKSANFSHTYLKNFDWSLKLVHSSDKFSKLNELKCSLTLETDKLNSKDNLTALELDKYQLDNLINTLETVQNVKFNLYGSE